MKSYTIRRFYTETVSPVESHTRKRRDAAERCFLRTVYAAIESIAWLDTKAGHRCWAEANALVARKNGYGAVEVGDATVVLAADTI